MNPGGEHLSGDSGISPISPIPTGFPVGAQPPSAPQTTPPPVVPAGWYPDPDNANGFRYGSVPSLRYFDGVSWTDQRAPMQRGPHNRQQPTPH